MEDCYNLFKEIKTAGFKQVQRESSDDAQQNKRSPICYLLSLVLAKQLYM